MNEVISSVSNPIIKNIKGLDKKKKRWDNKRYLIEGIKLIKESIDFDAEIEYILYSESLLHINNGRDILNLIKNKNIKCIEITEKIKKHISKTENSQGIFAIAKFSNYNIEDILKKDKSFLLILDRIQDPGNMGTIIRTADAFGVDGIIVTEGCVDVYNPKTVRSTMGSLFHIPIIFCENINESINLLKENDIKIMSTSLYKAEALYDIDFNTGFAFVIGNEANGVSENILNKSDVNIKIPMIGDAESLNAAIASSIVMYEAMRQRQNIAKIL